MLRLACMLLGIIVALHEGVQGHYYMVRNKYKLEEMDRNGRVEKTVKMSNTFKEYFDEPAMQMQMPLAPVDVWNPFELIPDNNYLPMQIPEYINPYAMPVEMHPIVQNVIKVFTAAAPSADEATETRLQPVVIFRAPEADVTEKTTTTAAAAGTTPATPVTTAKPAASTKTTPPSATTTTVAATEIPINAESTQSPGTPIVAADSSHNTDIDESQPLFEQTLPDFIREGLFNDPIGDTLKAGLNLLQEIAETGEDVSPALG